MIEARHKTVCFHLYGITSKSSEMGNWLVVFEGWGEEEEGSVFNRCDLLGG